MAANTATVLGGPTALIHLAGWTLLTDPTFDAAPPRRAAAFSPDGARLEPLGQFTDVGAAIAAAML